MEGFLKRRLLAVSAVGIVSADRGFGNAAFPQDRTEIIGDRLFGSVKPCVNGAIVADDRSRSEKSNQSSL